MPEWRSVIIIRLQPHGAMLTLPFRHWQKYTFPSMRPSSSTGKAAPACRTDQGTGKCDTFFVSSHPRPLSPRSYSVYMRENVHMLFTLSPSLNYLLERFLTTFPTLSPYDSWVSC
jgi:hypothetical protein